MNNIKLDNSKASKALLKEDAKRTYIDSFGQQESKNKGKSERDKLTNDFIDLTEHDTDLNTKRKDGIIDLTGIYSTSQTPNNPTTQTHDKFNRYIRQTTEQKAIIDHAIQLTNDKNYGNVIRVIAGAGTGKTTTLELLSAELLKLNQKILYLVYNKEAQREAISRFSNHPNLDCYTTHAAAMKFLNRSENTQKIPTDGRLLQEKIKSFYKDDIKLYLTKNSPLFNNSRKKKALLVSISLVGFWIFKTLETWIRTSKRALERNYYPIDKNQRGHQDRFKFPPGNFYMEKAMDVWERIWRGEFPVSFDCFLKYAQMGNRVVPQYDYIMLDESQDTTECVLDLFVTQQIKGVQKKNVYMVGDAVQCIYSFRGSKAQFVAQYPEPVINFKLTNCFRFGVDIAKVANLFLYIKENSPQSGSFNSYRLAGVSKNKGFVTRKELEYPKTIIGRNNCSMVVKALELLAEKPDLTVEILGGTDKMNATIKLAVKVYEFSRGIKKDIIFSEYEEFEDFLKSVQDEEQSDFTKVVGLIDHFGDCTLERLEVFRVMINKKGGRGCISDVCLTTCHQSKGKEFDRVEVLDDFIGLNTMPKIVSSQKAGVEEEFCLLSYGDELNLWYVAVTRARLEMRLPDKYWMLYEFMIETMNVGIIDGAYRLFDPYFKEFKEVLVISGSSNDDTLKWKLKKKLSTNEKPNSKG